MLALEQQRNLTIIHLKWTFKFKFKVASYSESLLIIPVRGIIESESPDADTTVCVLRWVSQTSRNITLRHGCQWHAYCTQAPAARVRVGIITCIA
jgi:hypothetical protein